MIKNISLNLCLSVVCCFGLVSCTSLWGSYYDEGEGANDGTVTSMSCLTDMASPNDLAQVYNKRVPPLNSLIVCRSRQCAPAELSSSKEYIFNALSHIIDNNLDATALLCEANPQSHVCINPYLTVPAKVGVTPAYVYFDGVKIVDASIDGESTGIKLTLLYNLSYNGQTPFVCKPDTAMMYVKSNNDVVLNGNGFQCDMTSMGKTFIRVMFAVDYIDLDYGYIGGYYSIGLSGPANGGGSGYGLIRLPEDTHPLNPVLTIQSGQMNNEVHPSSIVKPEVKGIMPEEKIVEEKKETQKASDIISNNEINNESLKSEVKENVAKVSQDNESDVMEDVYYDKPSKTLEKPRRPDYKMEYVVKSDKVVQRIKNANDEDNARVIDLKSSGPVEKFEEIFSEDLDEYIK